MLLISSSFILCLTKASKVCKIHCFVLKNRVSLFIPGLLFFPQINTKKNYLSMYLSCPNLIQKQVFKNILIFAVSLMFFIANVSDFTCILLVKIKTLSVHISVKTKLCKYFLVIKITLFKALYNIFKYKKVLNTFFFLSLF
jgi:hypothetical protein